MTWDTRTIDDGTRVIGAEVRDDRVTITYRKPSNMVFGDGSPVPDSVWRKTWVVQGGSLARTETETAHVRPAHSVAERVEWPSETNHDPE
jgi:hypothetical protein